jgi:hypothetical protein
VFCGAECGVDVVGIEGKWAFSMGHCGFGDGLGWVGKGWMALLKDTTTALPFPWVSLFFSAGLCRFLSVDGLNCFFCDDGWPCVL